MFSKVDTNKQRLRRHKRIRAKISGTTARPRLDVYRSNANISAQIIDDVNGVTLAAASTVEKDFGIYGGNCDAAKKVGAGLDKMAIHGVDPRTGNLAAGTIGNNYFDYVCADTAIAYNGSTPDANLESAIAVLEANEYAPSGIAMSPVMRAALGAMTNSANGAKYPGFQFGNFTDLGGIKVDSNVTVGSASGSNDRALVGDFAAFRWGFAKEVPLEVIEYGNPDNSDLGDLKGHNQVYLRGEAYVGWGIIDPSAFAIIKTNASA